MHINKKLTAALLFAVLVGVGYLGVSYFNPDLFASRESTNSNYMKVPPENPLVAQERAKPRFKGEILGIFLAPYGTPIPEKYAASGNLCTEPRSWEVPDEQAGVLTLDLELPKEYRLDADSMNTGTIACDGGVTVSRKDYIFQLPNGDTADVVIGRSLLSYDEINVAADRVRVQKIAGRDVVIVDTVTEDGYWDNAYAYFPESFGKTFISASSISRGEFMKLVTLVASSTRTQ